MSTQRVTLSQLLQQGAALDRAGRLADAIALYRAALQQEPRNLRLINALGIAHISAKQYDEACDVFRKSLEAQPGNFDAYNNLAGALRLKGKVDEAIAIYRDAIAAEPNNPDGHSNLGRALSDLGRYQDALACHERAVELAPQSAAALHSLGNTLAFLGHNERAVDIYRRVIAIDPRFPNAQHHLGIVLRNTGRVEEALVVHKHAMLQKPDDAEAHLNYALTLLVSGDLNRGWREYEWRSRSPALGLPFRKVDKPLWNGQFLDGKTLLVHPEQGLGDTLQCLRYLPILTQFGGRLVVECQPSLLPLARKIPGVEQWIERGQALPPIDVQCPVLSLPLALGTTIADIPSQTPYLHPDPERVEAWARKLGPRKQPLRVGLVWRGSAGHKNDHNRSLPENALAPLAAIPGVEFVSAQVNDPAGKPHAGPGVPLTDFTADIADFSDTAALLMNVDLLLTVDTSVAHLAGALARPVWNMLPFAPDWRWMLHREDTPWYPTMRLFRQSREREWGDVVERVASELARFRDATR